jgi:hypothetical protein
LKQVIVRKPKTSSIADDTCFLTVRPSDMAALKAAPQPEVEQHDAVSSTIVEDSDEEMELPPPKPVEKPVVVEKPAEVAAAPVEEKKKRVVSKKKE